MRAAEGDDVRLSGFAPIQGEVLAGEADGLGAPGRQVLGAVDRLPERAQVPPGESIWPRVPVVRPILARIRPLPVRRHAALPRDARPPILTADPTSFQAKRAAKM